MANHMNSPVPTPGPIDTSPSANKAAGVLFPSAARTHTGGVASDGVYATESMFNPDAKGVRLFSVVANGSGTVTTKIQVRDPATDAWVDLAGATTAALNNTTGIITTVYPGLTGIADSAGVTINQHLGVEWRAVATVATATETFSVGAVYLL